MSRLFTIIVMLFAIAATVGVATSHAMAYSSVAVAVPAGEIACGEADIAVVVSFKSCGKKPSGIVMPCNHHAGVLPQGWTLPAETPQARYATVSARPIASQPAGQHLRPPIAA